MSFLFRPQRGGLAEAMAEVQEFADKAALEAFLEQRVVEAPWYSFDQRIGWNTYIVIVKFKDGTSQPAGFANGPVE